MCIKLSMVKNSITFRWKKNIYRLLFLIKLKDLHYTKHKESFKMYFFKFNKNFECDKFSKKHVHF